MPEELPEKLEAKYGLVWDGLEITSCEGTFGQYLKYNNPHKFSLYMAAGIPVITQRKAAIANFIIENKVGIVVDNLENIKNVIENISSEEYETMCENTKKLVIKL